MTTTEHPPGWYPDPAPGAPERQQRYWTGAVWTQHVAIPELGPALAQPDRGRQSRKWLVVAGLLIVALVVAAGYVVTRPDDDHPDQWDAQVEPIAERVAALRGLSFEHPVRVRYLTEAEFKRTVAVQTHDVGPAARRRIKNLAGTLRALGLIEPNTDLLQSFDTANQSGVAGFYDPDRQEIVIRGTGSLDVLRKATLAHELTHVLQDQHFGLDEMRRDAADSSSASMGALTALIEGDAERIKFAYLQELPEPDRRAFDEAEAKEESAIDGEMAKVAQIVLIELGAPYALGPDVLDALAAQGGNAAVNDALRGPAPTDAIYFHPTAALDADDVVTVARPALDAGERQIGDADSLGAFDLFTLLASRIDRQVALDAADTWAGGRMVTYRSEGQVCVRASIVSTNLRGANTVAAALESWAATMPAASVTTNVRRNRATLTSCDTGSNPAPEPSKLSGALVLLGARNGILASMLEDDIPTTVSECVSDGLARSALFLRSLERERQELTATEQGEARRLTEALMRSCGEASPAG